MHEASHSRSGHEPSSDVGTSTTHARNSPDLSARNLPETSHRSTQERSLDNSSVQSHKDIVPAQSHKNDIVPDSNPSNNDVMDVCIVNKARFQIVSVTPVWVRELTPEDVKELKKAEDVKGPKKADGKEKALKDGEGKGEWFTYCDMRVIESVRKRTDLVQTDRCTCQEIASAVYRAVEMKDALLEVSVCMCVCVCVCVCA